MNAIAFRVDDIGAASKKNEIYGTTRFQLGPVHIPFPGNFLFLKYIKPFKKWGPYEELGVDEWRAVFDFCEQHRVKLTLGITAAWVEDDGALIPFPEKFKSQAEIIRSAERNGIVEIANHGLTHCVLDKRVFRPRWFQGNRKWHREFWDWVPSDIQEQNINESQKILTSFFQCDVVTFIPPGNVYTETTLKSAAKHGLRNLSCKIRTGINHSALTTIPDHCVMDFHDKEIVEHGTLWLDRMRMRVDGREILFIREIGDEIRKGTRS